MSAQVIRLWGGEHEHRMRLPQDPPPHPLPASATIIYLPDLRRLPYDPQRRRRIRVRRVNGRRVLSMSYR